MAVIYLGRLREQTRHYGFYKQASPTGDITVVRRKVGEPVDFMHISSRKVRLQREFFSQASKHYATLTPMQRLKQKYRAEEVEAIR